MNTKTLLAFYLLMLITQVRGLSQQTNERSYIIRNVHVISPEKKRPLLKNRDVYIADGKIAKISRASQKQPTNTHTTVDGTGKFLLPGLADMHAHLPTENREKYLLMNLLAGVTTLRSMRGDTSHLSLRSRIRVGEVLGPDLFISTPPITANGTIQERELPEMVAGYKQMGFDLIKVLSVPDSAFFEMLMTAAKSSNMLVAGHSPSQVTVKRVIGSGYSSIEHLQGLINAYQTDSAALGPLIQSLKKNNVYNCPTLDWYFITHRQFSLKELKARKGLEYLDENLVRNWIAQVEEYSMEQQQGNEENLNAKLQQDARYIQDKLRLLKILNDQDAPLLLSPDASTIFAIPGFNVHAEMKLYRRAGISNQDILKIAVYNPVQYMGQQERQGRIAPGMKANLVLLTHNPLDSIDNIQQIEAVITGGMFLKTDDIIGRLNNLNGI